MSERALHYKPLFLRSFLYTRRVRRYTWQMLRTAKFQIGQVVRHRVYPFRGIIFDVDPTFSNSDQWYESIPIDIRPHKDQPFYHLYAENEQTVYEAYVSEQNLLVDDSLVPLRHPSIAVDFIRADTGEYTPVNFQTH